MKKLILLTSAFMLMAFSGWSQKTVTGSVVDDGGVPLPGATVLEINTANGVTTDFDGNFSIQVADGATLEISFVGYDNQTITVGSQDNYEIVLSAGNELEEVVVTSLGLKREAKALGYAVQTVKSDEIANSGSNSAIDALVGKAAGVQITRSSGSAGGGSRILVRGVTSMIGNNQPLIVIDGVRTNNETLNSGSSTAGTAQSNRLMDLNNDDIESINILKGSAATALYGTAGAAGVVVITTKKGTKSEMQVSFTSQTGIDVMSSTIGLQNEYAQGSSGVYRDSSTGASGSWGPRMSELEFSNTRGFDNVPSSVVIRSSAFDAEGQYIYDNNGYLVPRGTGNGSSAITYDNVRPFFRDALSNLNSLSLSGGGDVATYHFSTSFLTNQGIVPNEEYGRKTFNLSSSIKASEKLTFTTTMNYIRSDYDRVQQGSNTSGLLLGMYRTPVSFDNANGFSHAEAVNQPSSYIFENGKQRNYRGGGGYDNPYWIVNNALRNETVNRFFGSFQANYNHNKWINVGLNIGADFTSDIRKQNFEIGSRTSSTGRIDKTEYTTFQTDAILNLTGGDDITDKLTLNYLLAFNAFSFQRTALDVTGSNLAFQGFTDLSNAALTTAGEDLLKNTQMGIVGQIEASYDDTYYLTVSARQDYDSRLGVPGTEFNASDYSFVYPAVSASVLVSELLPQNDIVSFAKVRASWAQVGGPPPFSYLTTSAYETTSVGDGWGDNISYPINGVTGFEIDNILGNSELKSELTEEIELGFDVRFFNNRVGLDFAWYQRKMSDAVLNASLPTSTGYTNVWLNSGKMTGTGIEATLNLNVIDKEDYSWNSQINYTSNENIVDELAPGLGKLFVAGFNAAGTYLIAGNQYGAIFGGAYLRSGAGGANDDGLNIPDGDLVINDDSTSSEYGYEQVDPTQRAIGNPNPDFIIGWNNSIRIKDVRIGFLFDWKEGGDMWNGTAWALSFFGRTPLTAQTRVETPAPIAGVLASNGQPNNINVVRDQSYWTSSLGGFGAVGEQFVQDAGWLRLRELSVSYDLPFDKMGVNFIKNGTLSFIGRNLWYDTDYDGVDPETSLTGSGNGQGFDYFNMPNTRSFIFKINLNL
jgi:TonB-linked SusC/RagA family outer membrane protein